ncbi:hypothetical protein CA54_10370 [Symmachiella macrocystis]|uniref:Lipoprotein n=1 Tax=Symmachiella macrocystis TaxID=2527985 RepID=A0A5C6BJH9_9PLAN|nr:hypothetical protein [Symmachiella macrocystis]TWU12218.1 hypothetical protein CA54_10370 [Symmachiella macrocystis]
MRALILCMLILPCCGCAFVSHQGPLTLGGRWHEQIPERQIDTHDDSIVVRAQSAAHETQRTLASTLEFAELLFVRAPAFVVSSAVLRPLGMSPEMNVAGAPRPVPLITRHSPDGRLYFDARKCELESKTKDPTAEVTFRIIGIGDSGLHMEQSFRVTDDMTFDYAKPEWDLESSVVTVTADDGRRFRIDYASAQDAAAREGTSKQ